MVLTPADACLETRYGSTIVGRNDCEYHCSTCAICASVSMKAFWINPMAVLLTPPPPYVALYHVLTELALVSEYSIELLNICIAVSSVIPDALPESWLTSIPFQVVSSGVVAFAHYQRWIFVS